MTQPIYQTTPEALTTLRKSLDQSVRTILKPRPKIAGDEWANRHFILSAETATEPGRYRWERAPYQREWLQVACDDHTQKIVLMTAARVGKSTALKAVTAYYMVNDPAAVMWLLPTKGHQSANANGTTSTANQTPGPRLDIGFSQILELPADKRLEALNLQYPQSNHGQAVKTYLQMIAAGLNMHYATLSGDSSGESYSTVRHGSQNERDHWKTVQKWYANRFHRRVYRAWLESALLSGALDLPDNPEDYYAVKFRARGFRWIDPLKDMKAYIDGVSAGFYTRTQVVAELGEDWSENILQLAAEQKFAAEHGIDLAATKPDPVTVTGVPVPPTRSPDVPKSADSKEIDANE